MKFFVQKKAIDTAIIFPVINSPPARVIKISTIGNTAPPIKFARLPHSCGKLPITRISSKKPKDIKAPLNHRCHWCSNLGSKFFPNFRILRSTPNKKA